MTDADQRREDGPRGALRVALVLAMCALVAVVLARALGGAFVYDDLLLVQQNPALASWRQLAEALGGAHWDFVEPDQAARIGYWRPLTLVALFVANQLGGGAPWAFHALSLALHLAATVVVFLLVERLTAQRGWSALFAALLFGLHPVQVESVAWISALNDPLAGLLVLAALLAFLDWRARGSPGAPLLACALFAFALLAKESAIAWLVLAPILDLARPTRAGERRFAPFVRAYAPVAAVVVAYWLARADVFGDAAAGFDRVTSHLYPTWMREITLRVELAGGALALLAWPAQLNLFREVRPEIPWNDRQLWIALLALALWLLGVWSAWRTRARVVLAALLVMLASLSPALVRIEAIGRFPLSEHFLYVSAFGAALLAATLLPKLLPKAAAWSVLAALVVACAARSYERTSYWKDELSVFGRGVEASPNSMYVRWGYGRVLLAEFQRTGALERMALAREQFEVAQDLATTLRDPSILDTPTDELMASIGVGWCQLFCALHLPDECTLEEAEAVFRGIIALAGQSAEAHCGLGVALSHLGRFDEAERELLEATKLNPRQRDSWFNLGCNALEQQQWSAALPYFSKCVELAPADTESWIALATAAVELDLGERAREALGRARALAPDDDRPLVLLGQLCAREQRFDKALEFFESALALNGSNGEAHLMRGRALVALQRPHDALQAFLDASRWLQDPKPTRRLLRQAFEAFYNVGVLLVQLGRPEQALPALEEARKRDPEGRWSSDLAGEVERVRRVLAQPPPRER